MTKSTCPKCKRRFKSLGKHWNYNESHRENIDDEIMDILTGILLGDGDVRKKGKRLPVFRVRMTNLDYLEWLDDKLDHLSASVRLSRTSEQSAGLSRKGGLNPNAKEENYRDYYCLTVVRHPDLFTFWDWYKDGEKRFPDDLELNPTILRHWFVCDGGLDWTSGKRAMAYIASVNESDRSDYLQSLFEDIGIEISWRDPRIMMNCGETSKFLRYIGDPPPGFEYKWKNRRRNVYQKLKEDAYDSEYEREQKTLEEWSGVKQVNGGNNRGQKQ